MAETSKEMTAAEAAKRVKRTVTSTEVTGKDEQGEPIVKKTSKQVAVTAAEVLAFKDYGTNVVVATTDGQKLSSAE
ncbi:hypothetical protein [Rhodoferax sp.]|uniref:hypothetical protein n=1 Tax=Rhodoferax sp. TaxID=50421 RepID=UPI00374DADF4